MAKKKQPAGRRRHVAQRTCVSCRRVGDKRTLVRVVRTKDGSVQIDPSGKLSGRGAYLCRTQTCWNKALKSSSLNRALKTILQAEDLANLKDFAADLPEEPEDASALTDATMAPRAPE